MRIYPLSDKVEEYLKNWKKRKDFAPILKPKDLNSKFTRGQAVIIGSKRTNSTYIRSKNG